MLKVGRIDFANCTPLFMALNEGGSLPDVELVNGHPTALNDLLSTGGIDLSPSSSIAYLRDPARLGFLPDLSISSIGDVGSVMLFSHVPLEKLDGRPVGLTPSSATSVVMLKVLLERFAGMKPEYIPQDMSADAALLIGDAALREVKSRSWPHVYDLGRLWHDATGTPFVFALWIVRRAAYEADPSAVRAFYRRLVAARQTAYRNYARYAREAPEAEWMGESDLLEYWGTLSYDLTAWHMAGLARFAREIAALGAIGDLPDLKPVPVEDAGAGIP